MEEEEEMKSQCFGGDYLGEVFDRSHAQASQLSETKTMVERLHVILYQIGCRRKYFNEKRK